MAPITNVKVLCIYELKGKKDRVPISKLFHPELPFLLLCTQSNQSSFVKIAVEDHGLPLEHMQVLFCSVKDAALVCLGRCFRHLCRISTHSLLFSDLNSAFGEILDVNNARYPKVKDNREPVEVVTTRDVASSTPTVSVYLCELKASLLKERNFNLQQPLRFALQAVYSRESLINGERPYWIASLPPAVVFAQASCFYKDKAFAEGCCALLARDVEVVDFLQQAYTTTVRGIPVGEFLWLIDIFVNVTSELDTWKFSESVESRNWLLQEVFANHQFGVADPTDPSEKQLFVDYKAVMQTFSGPSSNSKNAAKERGYCKLRRLSITSRKFSKHMASGDVVGILSQVRAKRLLSKWPARSYLLRISASDPSNLIMSYVTHEQQVISLILKVADDDELDRYIRRFPLIDCQKLQYPTYSKRYQAPELIDINQMSAPYVCRESALSAAAGPIPAAPPAPSSLVHPGHEFEMEMDENPAQAYGGSPSPYDASLMPQPAPPKPDSSQQTCLTVHYGHQQENVTVSPSTTYERLLEQVKLYWCIAPVPQVALVDANTRPLQGPVLRTPTEVYVVPQGW